MRRILWPRLGGVVSLVVFAAAQLICFVHCNLGSTQPDKDPLPPCHRMMASAPALPSCHAAVGDRSGSETQDKGHPWPMSGAACSTLKAMLVGADAPTVSAPDFAGLQPIALDDLTPAFVVAAGNRITSQFRQAKTGDRVFTPAVSPGPALHSLAPPSPGLA